MRQRARRTFRIFFDPSHVISRRRHGTPYPAVLLGSLLTVATPLFAANISWDTTKTGTQAFSNTANWVGGTITTSADSVFVTNVTTTSTLTNKTAGTFEIANFTMSNNTAGATTTVLFSNNTFRVDGTSLLGSNAVVQIGNALSSQATAQSST